MELQELKRNLFSYYLFGRKQSVQIGNETSQPEPIVCGVPQGSINVSDYIQRCWLSSSTFRYSNICWRQRYLPFEQITDQLQKKLQDFEFVENWRESIGLIMNTKKGKTEVMLFETSRKVKNQIIEIQHRLSTIFQSLSYKYLGVKLDQTLQLGDQIDPIYKKASGRLSLMKSLRPNLTVSAALSIYKAILLSIFIYCSVVTAVYSKSFEMKISRFEERAYGIIGRKTKVTIRNIQKKMLCTQVYKCIIQMY